MLHRVAFLMMLYNKAIFFANYKRNVNLKGLLPD